MSASNFESCTPFIFKEEGGMSRDRNDPGNWTGGKVGKGEFKGTNFGIAASSHPTLDIEHLTRGDAARIYRVEYWNPCACDNLDAGVDLVVFDVSVNAGAGRAKKDRDATATIGKPGERVEALSERRRSFYRGLGTFARYGKVWLGRVARIEAAATTMVLKASGLPRVAVQAELKRKAEEAAKGKSSAAGKAATAGAGAAAAPALPPSPSASHAASLPEWLPFVAGGVAVVLVIVAVIYFHRSRAQSARVIAFQDAARA